MFLQLTPTLTSPERQALHHASITGWLEVSPAIGDEALRQWQQHCQHQRKALALSRPEPTRTSIWLVLPDGCQWNQTQRALVMNLCTSGFILGENSLRAFAPLGGEAPLFAQLLAAL